MELSQLQYFKTAVEAGSISAASKQHFISHQALSKSISRLESELGAPLLVRHAGGVLPTECGYEVLRAYQEIETQVDLMKKRIATITDGTTSVVHVVFSDYLGISEGIFSEAFDACKDKGIRLTCSALDDDLCYDAIANRDADVAFVVSAEPVSRKSLRAKPVCPVPFYLSIDKSLGIDPADRIDDVKHRLHLPCRDATTESIIRTAFAHEKVFGGIVLERYDSSRTHFAAHLHDCCNASLVPAPYILAAESGTHIVRPFPSDGWSPNAYAIWDADRSNEPSLRFVRDLFSSLVKASPHTLPPDGVERRP